MDSFYTYQAHRADTSYYTAGRASKRACFATEVLLCSQVSDSLLNRYSTAVYSAAFLRVQRYLASKPISSAAGGTPNTTKHCSADAGREHACRLYGRLCPLGGC